MSATTTRAEPAMNAPAMRLSRRSRLIMLMCSFAALILVGALGIISQNWQEAEPQGRVFIIEEGTAAKLNMPTIDSAIVIPTDIRFGPNDVKRITIINKDSTMNRAGPWLIDAGQTYTLKFDKPGTYKFDCTVNAAESVTVTVTDK